MKAIKMDNTNSVLVQDDSGLQVWVDVYDDGGEITADWNKYIFFKHNPLDMKIKDFQEDLDNFDCATSVAIEYYETQKELV